MDSRQIVRIGIVVGIAILTIVAAVFLGRLRQPVQYELPGQDNTCTMPCMDGIRPGVTTFAEARLLVAELAAEECEFQSYPREEIDWISCGNIAVIGSHETGQVIRVIRYDGGYRLDDMIAIYGDPDELSISGGGVPEHPSWSYGLYWYSRGIVVASADVFSWPEVPIRPETGVAALSVSTEAALRANAAEQKDSPAGMAFTTWHGFSEDYRQFMGQ